MKSLRDYLRDLSEPAQVTEPAHIQEVDAMRKKKINAQISLDETEGLWNTEDDRWSRRAKHHFSQTEIRNAGEESPFSQGDMALYQGQTVEVRIPSGPNNTTGIMLEGHLRMVNRDRLTQIEESISGVMGGLKPMEPLNRIMQLAGLEHSGAVLESPEGEIQLDEAGAAGTMFNQLLTKNQQGAEYKNNPVAAKIATIGQILAGVQEMIDGMPEEQLGDLGAKIKMIPGLGVSLMQAAKKMTQPQAQAQAAEE